MLSTRSLSMLVIGFLLLGIAPLQSFAFDNSRTDNLAVYYGQNSYGATHSDTANYQKTLSYYCQDDSIDAIPIAFVNVFFGTGGVPSMDMSNICSINDDTVFPGTQLPDCSFLASDISTCQAKGKIVTISLGGATGAVGFSSDAQAETFADTMWNIFLGGSSSTRPFGTAVLDGIDLDIEGGTGTGYAAFVNRLRTHTNAASKKYYVTAAPQCVFPDASLGSVISAVGFDAIYVQFYNNWCGLQNYANTNAWNFGVWDDWAKNTSPNKNVKIYIGAPASSTAAGSGYVDVGALATIAKATRSQYSSFGGIMLWDASQAYANGRFDVAIKSAIKNTSGGSSTTTTTSKTTTTSSTTKTTSTSSTTKTTSSTTVGTGNCASVPAWQANVAYVGGSQVLYNGHLWTAKYWSQADVPGGSAGDWADDGLCATAATGFVAPSLIPEVAVTSTDIASSPSSTKSASPKAPANAKPTSSAETPKETSKVSRFFKFD